MKNCFKKVFHVLLSLAAITVFLQCGGGIGPSHAEDTGSALYFPAVSPVPGAQASTELVNIESREVSVTLYAYDSSGTLLDTIASSIPAGETKTIDALALPYGTVSLKVESDGSVIGNALSDGPTDGKNPVAGVEFSAKTTTKVVGRHSGLGVSFHSGVQPDGTLLVTITMNNKMFLTQFEGSYKEGVYKGGKVLRVDIIPLDKNTPKMKTQKDEETLLALYNSLKNKLDKTVLIEYRFLRVISYIHDFIPINEYFPGFKRGADYKSNSDVATYQVSPSICDSRGQTHSATYDFCKEWNDPSCENFFDTKFCICTRLEGKNYDLPIGIISSGCAGRCGEGCGPGGWVSLEGTRQYTEACLNHDYCVRNEGSLVDIDCNSEFWIASDDYICGSFGEECAPNCNPIIIAQMTTPTSEQTVFNSFTFKATAQDDSGTVINVTEKDKNGDFGAWGNINKVEFYVDSDTTPACTDSMPTISGSTFRCSWNTANKPNGSHTVKAKAYDPSNNSNFSTAVSFTINNTTTSITVISPNGGETWQAGTTKAINWTYTGSPGSYVKIELLKAGVLNRTITSSTLTSTGSYNWTIPSTQTAGSDYKVKVTSTSNSSYYDYSNNNFSITAPPTTGMVLSSVLCEFSEYWQIGPHLPDPI